MNLLDTDKFSAQKKYIAEKMRENKLESIASKPVKKRIFINRNIFLYGMFAFLIICGSMAISTDKFVVNADKLTEADTQVLGDSSAFSPSPLIAKVQKSAISTYVRGDQRILALKQFLESKSSPASAYADVFVSVADSVGMDYRLVASISGVESGFCKVTTIRIDSNLPTHNCWGWGKNGNRFAEYNSFSEAITAVTKGIAKGYGKNPDPSEMQYDYCHSCRGTTDWQDDVKGYMNDIATIEKKLEKH